jgi:hypothetical protein
MSLIRWSHENSELEPASRCRNRDVVLGDQRSLSGKLVKNVRVVLRDHIREILDSRDAANGFQTRQTADCGGFFEN